MKKFEKKLLRENNVQTGSVYRVKNKIYKWDTKNNDVHLQTDDLITILEIKRVTGHGHGGINGYIVTLLCNHKVLDLKFFKSDFTNLEKIC